MHLSSGSKTQQRVYLINLADHLGPAFGRNKRLLLASFCNQYMDMRMEIDEISEGLDYGHHFRHELKAGDCMQKLHKCPHSTETEQIEMIKVGRMSYFEKMDFLLIVNNPAKQK